MLKQKSAAKANGKFQKVLMKCAFKDSENEKIEQLKTKVNIRKREM